MANQEHLDILKQGVEVWNKWRVEHPNIQPDFISADLQQIDLSEITLSVTSFDNPKLRSNNISESDLKWVESSKGRYKLSAGSDSSGHHITVEMGIDLSNADLGNSNLSGANLQHACFTGANLVKTKLTCANCRFADFTGSDLLAANLSGANLQYAHLDDSRLTGANLMGADLSYAALTNATLRRVLSERQLVVSADLQGANLSGANLQHAYLSGADLSGANLTGVNLSSADLSRAILIDTILDNATLQDCIVYGISAWDVHLNEANQLNLIIMPKFHSKITVDNLEVAQFIYLLLNNKKIRDVIDTITSKVVLILGRFTPERKVILDALRDELRKKNYLPVVFDFEKPASRDLTETISTLAHIARFVIADITQAKSIPQELERIVPDLPSVPVQPLLQARAKEYGMFEHFKRYPWVLEAYRYKTIDHLIVSLKEHVIEPAEQKAKELEKR